MRGCPYHCAFCDIGESYWNKIYWFDLDRIRQEIEWMGNRQIEYVSVCDSNWGISDRDIDITQWVIDTKLCHGFPKFWDVTWAKNNRSRVQQIALMDKQAGTRLFKGITFSVQSLDTDTLEKVHRFNLTDRNLESGMRFFQERDIATYSEIIWPMPGETLNSFERGLQKLINMGQRDFLMVHPLVLTPNAPMNQGFYRRLNKLQSKNVPLDTFWLNVLGPDYVIETVDAVIGTDSVSLDQVLQGHMLSHWLIVMYYYGWAHVILEYLNRAQGISHVDQIKK
jgi:putative methyltransferase